MDRNSTSEMPVQRPAKEAEQFLWRQQQLRRQQEKRLELDNLFEWQEPLHTVPGRIATMVERYPDNLAVIDNAVSYTYRELDLASNRVANALLAEGGAEPEIVSLLLSPTAAAVVVALGVLKSGKAYVGYDDIYPWARCEQIMADTDCRTILADSDHNELARRLSTKDRKLLLIDQLFNYPDHNPGVWPAPDTVALLNYSSGTTGMPKGIVHTHHSIVAQASGFAVLSCLNSSDIVGDTASLAWAATFWHFFGPLFFGAAVATIDVRRFHVTQVMDWIDRIGMTVLAGRAYIRQILAAVGDRQLNGIRLVNLGGDSIYDQDIIATRKTFPKAIVTVGFGSSEAGRTMEWIIDRETAIEGAVVHVGLPAPGITVRLLDDDGQDVAPGKSGEIAIQSSYLAKEYWKQPDLTARRLLHADGEGPGLYLTGDVGRIRVDGALEHLGRKDFQIKIHGYQVPAVDIEGLLLAQPGIKEACVVKQHAQDGHELLIAFITVYPTSTPSIEALLSTLAAKLPNYMVPHHIVILPDLPKTPNSKLDRGHMPALERMRPALQVPYVAPASPIEKRLASIWEEVLDIAPVGIDDRFIFLGGDSLRAAQIANRVMAEFAVPLPLTDLLDAPTVSEMALLVLRYMLEQGDTIASSTELETLRQDRGQQSD